MTVDELIVKLMAVPGNARVMFSYTDCINLPVDSMIVDSHGDVYLSEG